MASHPLDRVVASDLSYETFQLRRRNGELRAPELNEFNRDTYRLPCVPVQRQSFLGSREAIVDSYQGEKRFQG